MPDFKIIGNPNPTVGEKQTYSIQDNFTPKIPLNNSHEKQNIFTQEVYWSIYQLKNNSWIHKPKNDKKGQTVDYSFFQATLDYEGIRLIAKRGEDKAIMEIKTKKSIERKIAHVDFLDADWNKPKRPFAYGDKVIVRVHCVNLDRCHGTVTLWENDASKKAKRTDINKNNKATTLPLYIEDGKGEVQFFLTPDFAAMANAQSDQNNKDEGQFHEYYVTVEIFNQKTFESENINVTNPDYKNRESQNSIPAEKKGPSEKETHGIKPTESIFDYLESKINVLTEIRQIGDSVRETLNKVLTVDDQTSTEAKENICSCKENNFYWSSRLTCDERKKVLEVCAKLWGEDKKKEKASELMAIMHLETGEKNMFKPYADNGADYSGLIQFSDASAKKLGTTRAELKKMTFIKQMDYVHDYFASKKEISNMVDLYLHVLKPNAVGNGNDPDYVLFDESISVPDGDGSQTSLEQRKINIGREPWVTKYGYSSNPSFMKGEEHTKRKKWVYTKQRYDDRWGFINGKTTVADVILELNEAHYNPGAKELFIGVCENTTKEENPKENTGERAPWMKIALDEAKSYGGKNESTIDTRIQTYHKDGGSSPGSGNETAWCSSFVCWCIEESGNQSPKSAGSRMFLDSKKVEKCDPFYGAIAIFSDCDSTGTKLQSSGHATFIFGELSEKNIYACLGGNQGDMLKISKYDCSGNVFISYTTKKGVKHYKIFRGFYKPRGYEIKEVDNLTKSDKYTSADEASKKVLKLNIKSNESGESSR
ncbi:hypothetical protein ASE40_16410 [Flavobacterium sp. Root935]|uniref:hypothetical protein n=1 Tax=Flavobacterium sp. Root935 TaxID=1736610 RepID=UPI0007099770|nr:hypothetical protein [Flavobacterium sp. Root935]KRD57929.1 hypothetical protein ASE40_16410 [Flavobacterium sp. Root935]